MLGDGDHHNNFHHPVKDQLTYTQWADSLQRKETVA